MSGPYRNYKNLRLSQSGLVCKGSRIIIPEASRASIIQEYHGQGHPGVDNTVLMITARFYWPGMNKQIKEFVMNCRTCSQCKHGPCPKASIQDHRKVEKLFEMISLDIGTMPISESGNKYFLLITDIFSKMTTAIPMKNATAETIVKCIWANWLGYYGVPKFLQSEENEKFILHKQ